jgi:hypothetical protein
MAQTTYLGFVTAPSGKRLVMQSGTHAFTTSATECTMPIHMRRVAAAHVTPGQVASLSKTAMVGGLLPYVSSTEQSATLAGTTAAYRIVVRRKTGSISACKFAYHIIGW